MSWGEQMEAARHVPHGRMRQQPAEQTIVTGIGEGG